MIEKIPFVLRPSKHEIPFFSNLLEVDCNVERGQPCTYSASASALSLRWRTASANMLSKS